MISDFFLKVFRFIDKLCAFWAGRLLKNFNCLQNHDVFFVYSLSMSARKDLQ